MRWGQQAVSGMLLATIAAAGTAAAPSQPYLGQKPSGLTAERRLRGLIHRQLHGVLDPGNCQLTGAEGRYTGQCGGLPSGQHVTMIELSEVEEIDSSVEPGVPDAHQLFTGRLALDEGRPVAIALAINVMGRGLIRNADDEFPITELIVDDFAEHLSFRIKHSGDAGYALEVGQ